MDVAALSMVMSQAKVQESAGIAVMKMAMDTGKDNATKVTEMMTNAAINPNIGQIFDAMAQLQMNEKEELIQELQQELQWVKYRQKMLDMMEEKLMEMKLLAEQAKQINMSSEELKMRKSLFNFQI